MVKEMDIIKTGATVVISAAAPAYDFAIKCTATGGKIIAIGVPHGAVPINIMQMIFDEISIITTNQGSKIELIEALQIAADLDVKPIYEVKPMSKINDGVADMLAGKIVGRVVYHWN
ncbi:hypothetical protein MMC08_004444 [Hypocenomyce scalaris]|nr:hypothetical protein [Hypocenomyce scalaris]